ncbi:MAG: c-type cytochrome [Ignavibacteria bacterium]|nr:c-type cytochrome [Ignavibacteria bacterium]
MNMELYMNILLLIVFLMLNAIFISLFRTPETAEEAALKEKKKTQLQIITDKLSGLKPIEQEHSLLLEGDYDGIRELDNNVPPWFNILFYGTIVIAVLYFLNYHVFKTGKLPFQEYSDEVYAAELQREELIRTGAFINESTVEFLSDDESITAGKQTFIANCVTCHGTAGEGTIGPNLTDDYWIHGGGIKNIFKTIKYGVPAKGMITWMNQFSPKKMQQVASYVMTLKGTNPPGGKTAEGLIYVETISDSLKTGADSSKTNAVNTGKDTLKKDIMIKDTANIKK